MQLRLNSGCPTFSCGKRRDFRPLLPSRAFAAESWVELRSRSCRSWQPSSLLARGRTAPTDDWRRRACSASWKNRASALPADDALQRTIDRGLRFFIFFRRDLRLNAIAFELE